MTLPRKGSRLISVDGEQYRWKVTGNDGYIDLNVEKSGVKGQKLRAVFDYHNFSPRGQTIPQQAITPGIVEKIIHKALEQGWKPNAGAMKDMRMDGEALE